MINELHYTNLEFQINVYKCMHVIWIVGKKNFQINVYMAILYATLFT